MAAEHSQSLYRLPSFSRRAARLLSRNFLVWRKLIISSITVHLIEPVIFLLGFGLGIGSLVEEVSGMSYLQFVAAGMMAYSVMNSASFEALYSAFTRMHVQRTWDSILHTPMALDDVVLGEWLWAAAKSMAAGLAMLLVLTVIGLADYPTALLALPAVAAGGLAFSGMALVFNAIARGYEFFSFYFSLFLMPMMILSGIFFPVDTMPPALQAVSSVLPLRFLGDMVRPLLNGEVPPFMLKNILLLLLYGIVGLYIATILTRRRFLL